MNRIDDAVAELAQPAGLARALAQAFDGVARRRACVAFSRGSNWASAFVADGGRGGTNMPREPMPVGCLAKLLTATLAIRVMAELGIGLHTRVTELLDLREARAVLARITLRQLLEHTHGLDCARIGPPPVRSGFIDVRELVLDVARWRPLAAPGAMYSYGNIGAWLIGAALERVVTRPFSQLLRERLLGPLGIQTDAASSPRAAVICPASGAGLALRVVDWLRFLNSEAVDRAVACAESTGEAASLSVTPLPGWNPLERGIRLGWKYHGHGWFGHQSAWPEASALVRVNPERRIALVVISRDHAASVISGRFLGSALPELFELRTPPLQRHDAVVSPERYLDRYGSAAFEVELAQSGAALELRVHDRLRDVRQRAALLPAAGHTFFTRRPVIESFPFIQLVEPHGGRFSYLWNGRSVLPRL
jgi:CubicO group peptidase (beta-lactamase class C family)